MPAKKKTTRSAKSTKAKAPAKKRTAGQTSTARKKPVAKKPASARPAAGTRKPKAPKETPAPVSKAVTAPPAVSPKAPESPAPSKTTVEETSPVVTIRVPPRKRPSSTGPEGFKPYQAKRGESYMNEAQKEHFRRILLAWKKELMEEVDRTVHHMQDEAANFPDPNDRATQESEFSLELRTRDRERKLIKKIDESLALIDADEYGYCESCGVEIGIRRLEARPTATQCIDCKTLDEIREKQMSG